MHLLSVTFVFCLFVLC